MDNRPPNFRFMEDKEEIARLRAEVDKSNKGLERAGEIETTLRAALREAEGKLAESQARAARMEGALEASTFLRDAVQSWCGFVMESLPKEARHAFRMNVTERLVLYDKAARALSGPWALEAVRGAVALIEDTWGKDSPTAQALRAAFGLEPKKLSETDAALGEGGRE